ncbi:hypothetical protein AB0K00_54715 [Dactylosporangium sp. NPDC049525]|uniref:hypothetical protein n=1 Tax=Dactylosporangium sp. NPDC049525 TaxID=3154730 RepID=UPI003448780B
MTRTDPRQPETLIRVAFYGLARNDPARDLAAQYQQCRHVVPGHYLATAFFDTTGAAVHEPPPTQLTINDAAVPRDGGLADLLDEAGSAARRFDFVIVADLDRLGRDTGRVSDILRHLVHCDVELLVRPDLSNGNREVPRHPPLQHLRSVAYLHALVTVCQEGDVR